MHDRPAHSKASVQVPALSQVSQVRLNASGSPRLQIEGGGRLVVGQKLYSLADDGGFNVLEALDGEIADYRIYATALRPDQIEDWMSCKQVDAGTPPLIDLENSTLQVKGYVEEGTVTTGEICGNHAPGFTIFFSEKMDFDDANTWCNKIKGDLVLPRNSEENYRFWEAFITYKEQCSDIWTHLFWIGVKGDLETGQWLALKDGKPIEWHNFLQVYRTVTPEISCIAAVSHEENKWAACPCQVQTCSVCSFASPTELRLRGLCGLSRMDHDYSFRANEDHKLVIDGLSHVQILQVNGTWLMQSRLYPSLWAEMIPERLGAYPLGAHVWEVHGDLCPNKKVRV